MDPPREAGDRSGRRIEGIGCAIALLGLFLLFVGLDDADPFIPFGSVDPQGSEVVQGRRTMIVATAILFAASVILAARGRWVPGAIVLSSGIVCTVLTHVAGPSEGWAWLAFAVLAPVAAGLSFPNRHVDGEFPRSRT